MRRDSRSGLIRRPAAANIPPMQTERSRPEPLRRAVAGRFRLELLPRQPYEARYTPDHAVIGFAFEGQTGMHAFARDRRTSYRTRPNSLAFTPAGCDVYSQSREGGEYLVLTGSPALPGVGAAPRRFTDVMQPMALGAAHSLRRLLLAGEPFDRLALEHHALALAETVSLVAGGSFREPRLASWMTPQRWRTVEALIEAKLDTALTLEELAGAVGLSPGFFARAFKAAMGKPPHAYILDRRIARARLLLASTDLDLSAVAYACGFASHAHMTSQFRNRLGVTPSALRCALL